MEGKNENLHNIVGVDVWDAVLNGYKKKYILVYRDDKLDFL